MSRPVGATFLPTKDSRFFVEPVGRGDTVVMIHDGTPERESWDSEFRAPAGSRAFTRAAHDSHASAGL